MKEGNMKTSDKDNSFDHIDDKDEDNDKDNDNNKATKPKLPPSDSHRVFVEVASLASLVPEEMENTTALKNSSRAAAAEILVPSAVSDAGGKDGNGVSEKASSEKKQVRFENSSSSASEQDAAAARRREAAAVARAQHRIKMGSGQPNLVRDLLIAAMGIAFVVWFAISSEDFGGGSANNNNNNKNNNSKNKHMSKKKKARTYQSKPLHRTTNKKKNIPGSDPINQMVNSLLKTTSHAFMERVEETRRKEKCALFLGPTSLTTIHHKQRHFSLFAGQAYQTGDVVLVVPWYIPLVVPPPHDHEQASFGSSSSSSSSFFFFASYSLFLKFHPTLHNVNGTVVLPPQPQQPSMMKGQYHPNDNPQQQQQNQHQQYAQQQDYVFRATQPIQPGDELFLPYENHPAAWLKQRQHQPPQYQQYHLHQDDKDRNAHPRFRFSGGGGGSSTYWYQDIPTAEDYQLADEITKTMYHKARQMEVAHSRRMPDGDSMVVRKLETSYLFSLGHDIVQKLHPTIAALVPSSRTEYQKRQRRNSGGGGSSTSSITPSHLFSLTNRSLSELQIMGSCLTDISISSSPVDRTAIEDDSDSDSRDRNTTLSVAVVATITTSTTTSRTFAQNDIIHIAPVHIMMMRQRQQTIGGGGEWWDPDGHCWSLGRVVLCPLTGLTLREAAAATSATTTAAATVSVSWHLTKQQQQQQQPWNDWSLEDVITQLSPGTLAIQVQAIQSILEMGQELIVANLTQMMEDLIPDHWR